MFVNASRSSVGVFLAGFAMLLIGAFALGTALAPGSEAGKQRHDTVNLNYVAYASSLTGENPCGSTDGLRFRENNIFENGKSPVNPDPVIEFTEITHDVNIYGKKFVRCKATLRVVP